MARPTDAVVAGSKGFALALFAPLAERTGSRPRIAPEPQQALALCAASSGVLVVEYGPEWLPVLQQLRRQAIGLRVIAALPKGQEAAALQLATIGADAVPWDGQPGPVLLAVDRLVAAAAAPRPAEPAPPRAAVTPPAGSPAQPAPPRLAVTPPAGSPAQPGPPRLAVTPPAGSPAQPAPPRLAVTPPAGSPAQAPAASPQAARPPGPVTAPPPAPPAPATPASPVAGGMDDLFSGYEAGGEQSAPGARVAAPPPVHASPLPPGATAPPLSHLPAPLAAGQPPAAPEWPALVTGEDEAEAALVLALRGALKPEAPLAGVATATLASLSELERQVLGGAALPFDTQPVYRAAVLRLRVASALATVPSPPARVDGAAVQRLLGELDAVLGEVKPLAAGAPPEHQLALEAVRNALVREAVNFSEAAHRLGEGSEPAPSVTARPHAPASAATPRVLSVQAGSDVVDERETRRRRTIWAIFAVVILAGAAVHGYRYFQREKAISALPSIPGAPDGMMLLPSRPGMPRTLMPVKGAPDRQQLEKFRAQQLLLGYKVIEQAGGVLVIVPVPPPAEGEPAR